MSTDLKAVEHALSLILNDPHFITSPKSAAFLSFVVSTTLKGDDHRLKAYTVAVDALGCRNHQGLHHQCRFNGITASTSTTTTTTM